MTFIFCLRTLGRTTAIAAATLITGFGVSLPLTAQPAAAPVPTPPARNTNITLEELWTDYKYGAKGVPGFNFRDQGNRYSRITDNAVEEVDFATGKAIGKLFDYELSRQKTAVATLPEKFDAYAFSDDDSKILITTENEPIYRRSRRANFYVVDRADGIMRALDPAGKQQYATFSPDGKYVAYVHANNLYLYEVASGERKQLTHDGEANAVINGATDWVYEEEFAVAQAFTWAPDSKSILFLRFDEREVPEFTMPMYINDAMYPEYRTWKYPKVGESNATVSAHVYEVASAKTRQLFDTQNGDTHIPRILFTPASEPIVWVTNRHQDTFRLLVERQPGAALEPLLIETSDTYLEVADDLTFLDDGSFLWTSGRSGFNHLYHFDEQGKLIRQLTSGNYPVTRFYGFDPAKRMLYFQAAMRSPMQREVYRLPLLPADAAKNARLKPEAIAETPGTNSAVFNGDYSGYMITHSSINTPPSYGVYDATGKLVRSLEDNTELKTIMRDEGVQPVEFFSFTSPAADKLHGWMITPPGFDSTAGDAYPLFMYQYSGPGSQQVVDAWRGANYWWFQMLAQQGYVIACVDGRGTGGRGEAFTKQTYLQLGKYELEDQISAAKYLGRRPYIDADRIGIFGWSYGGYMSSLAATKASDVFSLAIAVAPVTNWKWYDSLYTERYMRTTAENPDGYYDNSPINFAAGLEADYLLIHGMGDDNVHFQHSVEMAEALVDANKDFEFYAYPNRNHGIYGGTTRFHLYERMTEFIHENL